VQKPFFKISTDKATFYLDPPLAQKSANAFQLLDAQDNILTILAHDPVTMDVLPFFPKAMNDCKKRRTRRRDIIGVS
jgi:hypothetical protein